MMSAGIASSFPYSTRPLLFMLTTLIAAFDMPSQFAAATTLLYVHRERCLNCMYLFQLTPLLTMRRVRYIKVKKVYNVEIISLFPS